MNKIQAHNIFLLRMNCMLDSHIGARRMGSKLGMNGCAICSAVNEELEVRSRADATSQDAASIVIASVTFRMCRSNETSNVGSAHDFGASGGS